MQQLRYLQRGTPFWFTDGKCDFAYQDKVVIVLCVCDDDNPSGSPLHRDPFKASQRGRNAFLCIVSDVGIIYAYASSLTAKIL